MNAFLQQIVLAAPLFILVFVGYGLMRFFKWPKSMSDNMIRFVFSVALPAMLFRLMSDFSKLPPVDARLLLAFFGGCLIVFIMGRLVAWKLFGLDGVAQSVFALGGVFSNNVMLGLPLAKVALGEASVPSVALVLVFNALILWTLVTVSVEWARHGNFSVRGFAQTTRAVLTNPIVAAILSGALFGITGLPIPALIDAPLAMLGQPAPPLALVALGMGLAEYGVREGWRISLAISAMKLLVQPLVVWLLACWLGLPAMETQVVVLLASIAVGTNVYLMSRQFQSLEGPVASSLLLSTGLAAITTPLVLTLLDLPY
ncbi:Auxin Efflux Carrier [Candidatus Competibacter denitrificans Run_A_D11]|uniref:Auxin Efflux Carrier n=1 Tax=Candidatus Competibacter denitrificans Run_A_D11 TaxID=1400863 RepID=W6M252_9GAMM|nr:AEC family transporter [Candidatus Competibacter denitrificans]CDI01546.1 Auxin Efflux Carrier [Candidatus Competibacter denitrificans Run_A_D11]HAS87028.1 AEC family transporter [Candidatus Competibacteraceae bacterium]HRC70238.1 AEC family transporter [Candidatus Competibacter denitrificans]